MSTTATAIERPRGLKRLWAAALNPNMGMPLPCPECATVFSDGDAYCEDWRDPDRSFGCPKCHTFYRHAPACTDWGRVLPDLIKLAAVMVVTLGISVWTDIGLVTVPGGGQVHFGSVFGLMICALTPALLWTRWRKVDGPPLVAIRKPRTAAEGDN